MMNQSTVDRCNCTNCPGEDCQCGCQAAAFVAAPPACTCGPSCGCEGAEQGCVCH